MTQKISRNSKGQFVKGQSGNNKGRPLGRRENWSHISKILDQPVPVRRADGAYENLDRLEVAYLALCKKALGGEKKSLFKALDIMLKVTPPDEPSIQSGFVEPDFGDLPLPVKLLFVLADNTHILPKNMSPLMALGAISKNPDKSDPDIQKIYEALSKGPAETRLRSDLSVVE